MRAGKSQPKFYGGYVNKDWSGHAKGETEKVTGSEECSKFPDVCYRYDRSVDKGKVYYTHL